MVHNTNVITKYADQYQVVDKTTQSHAGYGESESGLTGRLMNKKINFSRQTTIITDCCRFRPRTIIHQPKCYPNLSITRRGTTELQHLFLVVEQILIEDVNCVTLATQNVKSSKKKIFRNKETVTAGSFFFYNKMLDWIGKNGYSTIGTCARNLLPRDIDKKYLHTEKHQSRCSYSKVTRFTQPIVAVKNGDRY